MTAFDRETQGVDVAAFTQALVNYADQLELVTPGSGLTMLTTGRNDAFTALTGATDPGKTLINSSVNGKSFGWEVTGISLEDNFQAFVNAIQEFTGKRITNTYADFSALQR